jgi:hypothetical protein
MAMGPEPHQSRAQSRYRIHLRELTILVAWTICGWFLVPSPATSPLSFAETQGAILRNDLQISGFDRPAASWNLRYAYVVNGQSYEATTFGPSNLQLYDLSLLDRKSKQYTVGGPVAVHYTATNPAVAYLYPEYGTAGGTLRTVFWVLTFGLWLGYVGVVLFG